MLGEPRKRACILRRETVGVAADDQRVNRYAARAQERVRAQQPVLPLPGLQAPDDPNHDRVRGRVEGHSARSRTLAVAIAMPVARRRSAGADDERRASGEQPLLRLGGAARGSPDGTGRQEGRHKIDAASRGDVVLPPDDPRRHPRERRRGCTVELRLRRPVEDHVGVAAAEDPRETHDRRKVAMDLAQAPGREHVHAVAA